MSIIIVTLKFNRTFYSFASLFFANVDTTVVLHWSNGSRAPALTQFPISPSGWVSRRGKRIKDRFTAAA